MKKRILTFLLSIFVLSATNAQVIFDPATYDASSLPDGMEIVEISGTKYLKVTLAGWGTSIPIDQTAVQAGDVINVQARLESGSSGYALSEVNTFLKFVDGNWTQLGANGSGSNADIVWYSVSITDAGTIATFQMAGQEKTGWSAISGDYLYFGKILGPDGYTNTPITEYDDFSGGSTTLMYARTATRSMKISGGEAVKKINSIPNIETVTKISCWLIRDNGLTPNNWNNGRIRVNSTGTGFTEASFNIPSGYDWVKAELDVTGMYNDGWAEFGIQSWNGGATYYVDDITFLNAAGEVVYVIDAMDGKEPTTNEGSVSGGITKKYVPNAWINEIDYVQNGGADATSYDDMLELVIYKPTKHDYEDFTVVLYDGFSGTAFNTKTLNDFIPGDKELDFQLFHTTYDGSLSDVKAGIALVYQDEVVSFVSYGGSFLAVDGPAMGMAAKDVGVEESGADNMSVQLTGDGFQYQDFTWVDPLVSAGSANGGQNLTDPPPVPLDGNYIYFLFIAIAAVVVIRKFV